MAFVSSISVLRASRCTFTSNTISSPSQRSRINVRPVRRARWHANVSSNDFKTGMTIELDGIVYKVNEFLHVKPGKGAAFVRTKLRNMKTGNILDKTFRAGENVRSASLDKVVMQHTYVDGNDFVFMNMETFEEERLNAKTLGDAVAKFLMIGMNVDVLKHNDEILGVDIPKNISYTVVQTEPGIKGNTATNATKPATIESGAEIMVPLFISQGEKIRVDTTSGKYVSRDNN